ncbi:MAG: winged helix-turn-helix transcriptional regulator [Gammaproteobacteria bacterium]
MENQGKNNNSSVTVSRMVEDIVGCKWSLSVIEAVKNDIVRPGEIQRSIEGISTKVLNERFNKMLRYGILEKTIFPEVPPRVEYQLTAFGNKFIIILDQISALQSEMQCTNLE